MSDERLYCVLESYMSVKSEHLEWLWPERFPLGKFSMIIGIQGMGKSFLSLYMAAQVSTGRPWVDRPGEKREPGDVLLLSAEDDSADTVKPRLEAMGADMGRVKRIKGYVKEESFHSGPYSLASKESMLILNDGVRSLPDLKLIVIDPITAYMQGIDENKNVEVRAFVSLLAAMAVERNVAIVGISHLNKNEKMSPEHRMLGSTGFAAAARAIWLVQEDKINPERKLMVAFKGNLSRKTTGLAYQIASMQVKLDDGSVDSIGYCLFENTPLILTAADLLTPQENGTGRPRKQESAREWLEKYLGDGPKDSDDVIRDGEAAGYGERTLRTVKTKMRIQSIKSSPSGVDGSLYHWAWSLPSEG